MRPVNEKPDKAVSGLNKPRLDQALVERGLSNSRQRAQALVMAGEVWVDGRRVDKPGTRISKESEIRLKATDMPYVSRGALKLEAAINQLHIDVTRLVCLDVGASTGGFTDCLLQHGAARVYAVDVGYGQLAWQLRQDLRVQVIDRTNIRYMPKETVPEDIDLATIDTSFISLKLVVPAVLKFLKPDSRILALIKPQFEVGKGKVGKGGIVRDPALHEAVIHELSEFFTHIGLSCEAVIPSPIKGQKGNREFVADLKYAGGTTIKVE